VAIADLAAVWRPAYPDQESGGLMFADFHFLNPHWFLLLIPAAVLLWRLFKQHAVRSEWEGVIEPQLIRHLLVENRQPVKRWPMWLTIAGILVAITALANPVWEKKPQQVYQTPRALVIVLDLSASMNAADLAPSRIVQTRLKIQDILNRQNEGLTGLVVFAGDAFSVTPLTRDNQTILSQLRVLEPDIMPVQGSRADLGLAMAADLLQQAGINEGDVLLFADGFDTTRTTLEARKLHDQGHRVSVVGTATEQGAPVSDGRGDVIRDLDNIPVLSRLDSAAMQSVANQGGGIFHALTTDNADIDRFLSMPPLNRDRSDELQGMMQIQWQENGPYLVVLLLPLAALAFRRGWIMMLIPFLILHQPQPAMAVDWQAEWNNLWQTPEQQASEALQQGDHEKVLANTTDPALKGSALYRQQQYEGAMEHFNQLDSADANYNRGNALAHLQRYEDAIAAYDKALATRPDMQDAIENRKLIEELLKKQQEQQKQEQQQPSPEQQQNDSQQQDPSEQNQQGQQKDKQQQENSPAESAQESGQQDSSDQQQSKQADNKDSDQAQQDKASEQNEQQGESAQNNEQQQAEQQPQQAEQAQSAEPEQRPQPLDSESAMATEQWLRRIPDDPGGLLKRKFMYQYQQRNRQPVTEQAW
jgi:Ca-activated chloride channel family protein